MSTKPAEGRQLHQLPRTGCGGERVDAAHPLGWPNKHAQVWLFGMAFGLVVQWPSLRSHHLSQWLPDLLVGWVLLSCGLVLARVRSGTLTGGLLTAAGLAWFVPDLLRLAPEGLASARALTLFWHRGPLLHVVLAYPTGRATSRLIAAVIAGMYAAALLQPFWWGDGLAVLSGAVVLLACACRYAASAPQRRRARLLALAAAIVWTASIASGALVRSTSDAPGNTRVPLLAYEAAVCAIAVALTVGFRAGSLEQAVVTDLVVELGEIPGADIRGLLAEVLGDPGLVVGYWDADTGSYLDTSGRVVHGNDEPSGRSLTFVEGDGQPLALLVHDPVVLDDPALVEGVSAAIRLVAAHGRLQAEVQGRVAEVRTSRRRILDSADEERVRLERRVQAGAVRRLDTLAALLGHAGETADDDTKALIAKAQTQLDRTLQELRQLARGIHPRVLSEHGLAAALTALVNDVALPVELQVSAGQASAAVQACAYFVCSEALANISKYAGATAVRITVRAGTGGLTVEVTDDGVGGAVPGAGTGLQGLTDRVQTLGGRLVVSSPVDGGTRIVAAIPMHTNQKTAALGTLTRPPNSPSESEVPAPVGSLPSAAGSAR